jgi:hypothetical protein
LTVGPDSLDGSIVNGGRVEHPAISDTPAHMPSTKFLSRRPATAGARAKSAIRPPLYSPDGIIARMPIGDNIQGIGRLFADFRRIHDLLLIGLPGIENSVSTGFATCADQRDMPPTVGQSVVVKAKPSAAAPIEHFDPAACLFAQGYKKSDFVA